MSTIVSTQFQLPTTVISNGAVTGNAWSNPNNVLLVDGDVAESNPGNVASDIIIGNFNSDIPVGAVILGIEIEIFAYRGAQVSPVITLTPIAVDNTSGSPIYYQYVTPITTLTPAMQSIVIGSPTYLFGTTWTVDQINNFKLQLEANGDVYVDSALLKVFYQIPDPVTPPSGPTSFALDGNSPIQAQQFQLALPFMPGDRFAYLQSFNYPNNIPIEFADLGSIGGQLCFTFDPGKPLSDDGGNFEENCVTTVAWTTTSSGFVQLDFNADLSGRGIQFHEPYAPDSTLISGHDENAIVVISNSAVFESRFLRTSQRNYAFQYPIEVRNQGTAIQEFINFLNFNGAGVTATTDGTGGITIEIDGTTGGFVTLTGVQTLTNKRITKRDVVVTQSATPVINTDNLDIASITGLAQAITSMTTNLTGTPNAGDLLMIQFTDNGTPRAITWGSKFEATTIGLPTTTVAGILLRVGFQWNTVTSKWSCIAVA